MGSCSWRAAGSVARCATFASRRATSRHSRAWRPSASSGGRSRASSGPPWCQPSAWRRSRSRARPSIDGGSRVSAIRDQVDDAITVEGATDFGQARRVLANPRFLALFGSQILTQVGGNMVLFGLTVTVFSLTDSSTSVSILLLTFLVPAVVFGAIAGVFVDMFDRRWILISTNVARAALYLSLILFTDQLAVIYLVTAIVATLTTFFAPAEAAMIPLVVKRQQLMTANGLFVLALQASFVLGFAVLG